MVQSRFFSYSMFLALNVNNRGGSINAGTPKSSMLIGFSLVNHPNASIYGNPFRSRMIILYNIDLGESEWRMEKVFMEVQ
jgi:hypothetical protein